MNSCSESVTDTDSYLSEVSSNSTVSYSKDENADKMVPSHHNHHDHHNDSVDYLSRQTVLDMHYSPFMNKNFHLRRSYSIYADSLYLRNEKPSEVKDDESDDDDSVEGEGQSQMHIMINKIIKVRASGITFCQSVLSSSKFCPFTDGRVRF